MQHILNFEGLDNPVFPSNGYQVKIDSEISGLSRDVHFRKVELKSDLMKEVSLKLVSGYCRKFGCILSVVMS